MMRAEERNLVAVSYSVRFEVILDHDTGEVEGVRARGLNSSSEEPADSLLPDGSYGEPVHLGSWWGVTRDRARLEADRFRAMLEAGEEVV